MVMQDDMRSGHRARLRERFLADNGAAMPDYELLELLLFSAKPRGDVKPLAKALIKKFGSLAEVIHASQTELSTIEGMGNAAITSIKANHQIIKRVVKHEVSARNVIQSWESLLDYCRTAMGHEKTEQFRILFLDNKHGLIKDEVQNTGTVNHTPVYPREVVKRALELGASAIILAHNHPSGDPTPSKADIHMTKAIVNAAEAVAIKVHDHLIVTKMEHYSFKSHGLI